jgi:hypothetical protein
LRTLVLARAANVCLGHSPITKTAAPGSQAVEGADASNVVLESDPDAILARISRHTAALPTNPMKTVIFQPPNDELTPLARLPLFAPPATVLPRFATPKRMQVTDRAWPRTAKAVVVPT